MLVAWELERSANLARDRFLGPLWVIGPYVVWSAGSSEHGSLHSQIGDNWLIISVLILPHCRGLDRNNNNNNNNNKIEFYGQVG